MSSSPLSRRLAPTLALAALLVGLVAGAAHAYSYFRAAELDRQIADRVGEEVMVVDRLVKIWSYQDVDGYLRFETERFRCAVANTETESIAILREIAKNRADGNPTPPLVALFGNVTRAPLWGEVKGGESDGVVSEQIVLVCDRIEVPRARFYVDGH